ncbi:hypothetical protein DEU32_11435 [Curtobacterium sp. AG1037]|uniref:hypothetical protein n=1 Tax=Curtobacterium sp. AG1037 TaxID=2183990 RepID=UPI000E0AE005|nr:hypothetical protein [Curtobacterium sp. AG1037]RDH95070.1 hypothetical protein DEU32_11435 [Curtobacterium sp. AG1037]
MAENTAFTYTLDTARRRLLELEYDVTNERSTAGKASHLNEALNVIRSTALGRDEGPALVDATRNLQDTAGRQGMTVDIVSDARAQSLQAAWGAFERNPFDGWTGHDLSDDIAYFAEGSAQPHNLGRVAELTPEERRAEATDALGRVDEWSREGIHTAMTNAVSTAAVYEGYPETKALVDEVRFVYETARTTPGAFAELQTFDQVLDAANPNRSQPAAEQSSTRDRIRENFAAQRDGVAPVGRDDLLQRMTAAFQHGLQERQDRAERGAYSLDAVQARAADRVRDISLAESTTTRLIDSLPDTSRTPVEHPISGHEAADLETMARLHGKWGGTDPVIADRVDVVDRIATQTTTRPSISDADQNSYAGFDKRAWDGWQDVERKELANNTAEQKTIVQALSGQQQSASFPQSAAAQLNASVGQAQPAPSFRSGRGFGTPTRDAGVER